MYFYSVFQNESNFDRHIEVVTMESIAIDSLLLLSKMEQCPVCQEYSYASHQDRGIQGCHTCDEKVCSTCFFGCRYTCPIAAPKPKELERQLNIAHWEDAEDYLREHTECNELVVQYIPDTHLYKLLRDENGNLLRLHYDRVCLSCSQLFLHEKDADKVFVCQDCLEEQ